jgi:uncharacterized protein (DUF2141 family)
VERRKRNADVRTSFAAGAAVVALVFATQAAADPPPSAPITVKITSLRSNAGQVGCMIYNSPKGFPVDPEAALQRVWCPIDKAASSCPFAPVPAGVYAIACFHDENKNGKFDRGFLGIPKEGAVASNYAKGFMGPPPYEKAKFSFAGTATEMELKMGY